MIEFAKNEDCAPASERSLRAFEAEYNISLPIVYRQFLGRSSGGYPKRDLSQFGNAGDFVAHIYGIHEGAEWKRLSHAVKEFGHDLTGFLPVAISNGGNYFLLRLSEPDRGGVYFWDHELEYSSPPRFDSIIRICGSFTDWLDSLKDPDRSA